MSNTTHIQTENGGSNRTAIFVQQDSSIRYVRRRLKHALTLDEWNDPAHRSAKIAECWKLALANLRAEGMYFVAPVPVTLYRNSMGRVLLADIRTPDQPDHQFIDPFGTPILKPNLFGLVPERTTYMHWAEGPLSYTGADPIAAPDPFEDRYLQYLRHQNSAIKRVIDAAMDASRDELPQDIYFDGVVDLRVRGVFATTAPAIYESKQTNVEAAVKLDGQMIDVADLTQ